MKRVEYELLMARARQESRRDFYCFRQFLNGSHFVKSDWQKLACRDLMVFTDLLFAGKRPKLVIEAPPQHGKSRMVVEYLAWVLGKYKEKGIKVIYTSFSEALGVRANLGLQRILFSERFKFIFGDLFSGADLSKGRQNSSLLEFAGGGVFRNTTIRGAITGETLDLGVIDDPIKGREEAGSQAVRDKVWDWFTDDFFTRFSKDAGFLAILTRWHIDDPIGRLKAANADVKTLSFKAIAEKDESFRKAGEALFPELKPLDFLLERKAAMANANWEALYQQNPQVVGGEIIHAESFRLYDVWPRVVDCAIFADTAQKTGTANDYSVFQLWGSGAEGGFYLIDQLRGKWEAPELERRANIFWQKCVGCGFNPRFFAVEDKVSGTGLIQRLKFEKRVPVRAIQRSADKYSRLLDVLGYIESGYVYLPRAADWLNDFLSECESFSADFRHAHDDQIDPMVDALEYLTSKNRRVNIWENII